MSVMDFVNLEFADDKVKKVQEMLPAVRSSRANVLICGPTGTGKTTLAKYLLNPVECAYIDASEIAENFNFSAFFENSDRGAYLLENIDRLSPQQQKSLFEALESSGTLEKIRVVSSSRGNLKSMVQKGQFREDLYYRLTVLNLELPALGQRLCDLEILAKHLVSVFAIIHQKSNLVLSPEALEKMKLWSWPGNIRELENVLERAVILAEGSVIQASHIAIESPESLDESVGFAGMTLSQVEQKLILQTLQLTEQNRTRAAEILGISIRTLRNKINEYRQAGLV
ncbi:sigma-54-dependent transcriptional regulator [Bdellovibrio sp. HCB337]|uniref:sigma-54-dependent transcriptional regulator n=1 Tax=Bdellovibrio sp. HCB337 TaxID=3394358 RepID=UPI0039A61335